MHRFVANDRYTAESLLGEGASARVYAARDASGQRVALKLLSSDRSDDFEALRREFLVLSHLDHPLVAQVFDFGRLGPERTPYIAEELVEGQSLSEAAAGDPLKAAGIGAQIAWALAHVHGSGLVHLDIKPANARMVDGRVKLLDFGLCRDAGSAGSGGTPAYVAPEVLRGEAFDGRADLYGLGGLLYCLVTGRPPYIGATLGELVEQALHSTPLELLQVAPDCPPALSRLVAQLLSSNPAARPDSAAEVTRRLMAIDGVSVPALPVGSPGCIGRQTLEAELDRTEGLRFLTGPAGVGKRYLTRRWLLRARAEGRRTAEADGRGLEALTEALGQLGATVAHPPMPGANAADRRRNQLAALAAAVPADASIVLHGADDLVDCPAVAGQVVVTATEPVDGCLALLPFTSAEVQAFLTASRPGVAVTEVDIKRALDRTGGLPLRLARYAANPDAELESASLLRGLTEHERRLLFSAALVPAPADQAALAVCAGLSPSDVAKALVGLLRRGLLVAELRGSYRLSPPALADVLLSDPPADSAEVAKRALRWGPTLSALRLAGDATALTAELETRLGLARDLRTRRDLLVELVDVTASTDRLEQLESCLDELGDRPGQAAVLAQLVARCPDDAGVAVRDAFLAMWTSDGERARASAGRARGLTTDVEVIARSWRAEGLVAQRAGDYQAASEAFGRARAALPIEGGDAILRAHTVHDAGVSALYLGRYAEALPCFRESLALKVAHGDQTGARIARQNLGICYEAMGEPRRALRAWEEAAQRAQEQGAARGEAWNHMALGGLLRRLGQRGPALSHLDAAEKIAEALGQPYLLTGVKAERALLEGTAEAMTTSRRELLAAGDGYNADRLGLELAQQALRAGGRCDEPVPGAESFPERHAALQLLANVRAGTIDELSSGDAPDTVTAVAIAEWLTERDRPHEAEALLRESLDRAWATDERDWLADLLGDAGGGGSDGLLAMRVLDVARGLSGLGDADQILARVLDAAIGLAAAERGFVLSADTAEPRVVAARSLDGEALPHDIARLSRGVTSMVLTTGEPLRLTDAQAHDELSADRSIAHLGLKSVLCVPLRTRGEVIGCLYLDHRFRGGVFGPALVRFVELLADQAANAVAQARLTAAIRAQAEELQRTNRTLLVQATAAQSELERTRTLLEQTRSALVPAFEYPGIIGSSRALNKTLIVLDKVIPTDLSVLVEGESGTGKELLARAIHTLGPRAGGPFVAVNCGAIPDNLFESTFFGHKRGAFTGADRDREGYFALAHRGTLFLDEVGELPLTAQARLLRVLETGTFWPVGASAEASADVRIVTATNRDLTDMVKAGGFREDLFYRLAHVRVPIPPLRQRRDDVPPLVAHFLKGREIADLALAALRKHGWPGNIRELRNVLERALAMSAGGRVELEHLDLTTGLTAPTDGGLPPFDGDLKTYINDIERELIVQTLRELRYNKSRVAAYLGFSRPGLRQKMEKLGIRGDPAR